MGIMSWRGKASEAVEMVTETSTTSGSDISVAADTNSNVVLGRLKKKNQWDPFMELDTLDAGSTVLQTDLEKDVIVEGPVLQEDSPYAEVRSAVKPVDDPDAYVDTIRAWVLGALMCTIVAACNIILGLRRSPIAITATVVQLIAYPIGNAWAKFMPNARFRFLGRDCQLNPGPFNVKEHTLITIMTAAGASNSYAFDILLAQEVFYKQFFSWGFQLLLIVSTQAMGLGLAGILRRLLVYPAAMVWPSTLIFSTVVNALHDHAPSDPAKTNGWRIGRYKFFLVVAAITFIWEWVPQVIATFLQMFTFVCWIAPQNVAVNQVFGGQTGLGLIPLSFDWATISGFLSSPLPVPGFAILNVAAGTLFMFIAILGLAYGGPEAYRYLPLAANSNFDHFGQHYNTSKILHPNITFDEAGYREYSPLYMGAASSLNYGLGFAALTSTVVHVVLFYGTDIINRVKSANNEEADIHLKLMRQYKEAPWWWFAAVFLVSFGFGMAASLGWETHLPAWGYILCIALGVFFIVPVGMIQAITNQQTGLNIISEMIWGYIQPGKPVALMMFKSWGYMTCANSLNYIQDMKIGQYMKIPPRSMFAAQLFAVTWLSVVQVATYNFVRNHIDGICTPNQAQGLTCPAARTFYNASVIWGVLGPARMFGWGALYAWVNYFWLIGAAVPVIHYLLARRYPRSWLRYVFTPTLFGAAGLIPPATPWYLGQWAIVGVIFNVYIRRRYPGWWSRYTYTLSGALDIGTSLVVVLAALGLGLGASSFPSWWGNTVWENNLDAEGTAVSKVLPDDGSFFGVTEW